MTYTHANAIESWGLDASQYKRTGDVITLQMLSVRAAAAAIGRSPRRVIDLCAQRRIVGASKFRGRWRIPSPVIVAGA